MFPKNRQTAHLDASFEELTACFTSIAENFGQTWLENKSAPHRLQQLWQRKDALATNELFSFGKALVTVQALNRNWLEQQLKIIRQNDENNQNGAFFEIMCIAMMSCAGMSIAPASQNQKGFDATVTFESGRQARVSMKNYRMTSHEKEFHQKCKQLRTKTLSAFRPKMSAARFFISMPTFPARGDWDSAWKLLSNMARSGERGIVVDSKEMKVGVMPLLADDPNGAQLSEKHFSDLFLVLSHHSCPKQIMTPDHPKV